ncbi:MAG: ClpX C4-type zinc finger protein [Ktedonobacteraceae bacterium]
MWNNINLESSTCSQCSFCGQSRDQVQRLIAGPGGVCICNECVALYREHIDKIAGEPISMEKLMQVCPSCGNRPPASHRYCYQCGFHFTQET